MSDSLASLRRTYALRSLHEAEAQADPLQQFRLWLDDAVAAQVNEPSAMSVATVSAAGEPSVRTVLLKGLDHTGFVFYTNYASAKGHDLAANPRAALLFFWSALERQVRIAGAVSRVPREQSAAYFATRPVESQWGAWASVQSAEVSGRDELERAFVAVQQRFPEHVPCPPEWGGYHVTAERVEFWQGRPGRLHDRLLYQRLVDGTWSLVRLAP